jgi:hypothetical protein
MSKEENTLEISGSKRTPWSNLFSNFAMDLKKYEMIIAIIF